MSARLTRNPPTTNPELLDLIERAKDIPITPEMAEAQRRSWVTGELMLEHPEMTKAEANRRYDVALGRQGDEG